MEKRRRVKIANQLTIITLDNGEQYPFDLRCVRIEIDTKRPAAKKKHQVIYQQGKQYGGVGDYCYSITHDELFELEKKGMIQILPKSTNNAF